MTLAALLKHLRAPSPALVMLKPLTAGTPWCLLVGVSIDGDPATYTFPEVSFSGYTVSGSLPAGSVKTKS
jgi:hypothetical protein